MPKIEPSQIDDKAEMDLEAFSEEGIEAVEGLDTAEGGKEESPAIELHEYRRIWEADHVCRDDMDMIAKNIHDKLTHGIEKRLVAVCTARYIWCGLLSFPAFRAGAASGAGPAGRTGAGPEEGGAAVLLPADAGRVYGCGKFGERACAGNPDTG